MTLRGQLIGRSVLMTSTTLLALGLLVSMLARSALDKQADLNLRSTAALLRQNIQTSYAVQLTQLRGAVAGLRVKAAGPVTLSAQSSRRTVENQNTHETTSVEVPDLLLRGQPVATDTEWVDSARADFDSAVTIFVLIPGGMLRVATTVQKQDGTRAKDTYIPATSPVHQSIAQGREYFGRAVVVGEWYATGYTPLFEQGTHRVVGALFAGLRETDLDAVRRTVLGARNSEAGLAAVFTSDAKIVAATIEGVQETLHEADMREMMARKQGVMRLEAKGQAGSAKAVLAAFDSIPELGWTIVVGSTEEELHAGITNMYWATAGLVLLALLVTTAATYRVAQRVSGPIKRVAIVAEKVAAGDLSSEVVCERGSDEVGNLTASISKMQSELRRRVEDMQELADGNLTVTVVPASANDAVGKALSEMVSRLEYTVREIRVASDQVATEAKEVGDASESLMQGATEQAASIEEITSSLTEVSARAKRSAEDAADANQLVGAAREAVMQGNDQMKSMVAAIRELSAAGTKIADISKVIDSIAFQTNLLALNAAVEAARAGKQGKGFAVVAGEVRSLAGRSAKAAKEATEIIGATTEKVARGLDAALTSEQAFAAILQHVMNTADRVGDIASANREQAESIAQISQGLDRIDSVGQRSTAASEELAAAARQLGEQAAHVRELIGRFRVDTARGTKPASRRDALERSSESRRVVRQAS